MGITKIACRQVNGVRIRLFKPGYDDGTGDGVKPIVGDGPLVLLRGPSPVHAGAGDTGSLSSAPVINEVDADFADKWFAQNENNPLVKQGFVYRVEDGPNPTP
jgi:hypothetical protein